MTCDDVHSLDETEGVEFITYANHLALLVRKGIRSVSNNRMDLHDLPQKKSKVALLVHEEAL